MPELHRISPFQHLKVLGIDEFGKLLLAESCIVQPVIIRERCRKRCTRLLVPNDLKIYGVGLSDQLGPGPIRKFRAYLSFFVFLSSHWHVTKTQTTSTWWSVILVNEGSIWRSRTCKDYCSGVKDILGTSCQLARWIAPYVSLNPSTWINQAPFFKGTNFNVWHPCPLA